jgi:hypothetical protein
VRVGDVKQHHGTLREFLRNICRYKLTGHAREALRRVGEHVNCGEPVAALRPMPEAVLQRLTDGLPLEKGPSLRIHGHAVRRPISVRVDSGGPLRNGNGRGGSQIGDEVVGPGVNDAIQVEVSIRGIGNERGRRRDSGLVLGQIGALFLPVSLLRGASAEEGHESVRPVVGREGGEGLNVTCPSGQRCEYLGGGGRSIEKTVCRQVAELAAEVDGHYAGSAAELGGGKKKTGLREGTVAATYTLARR